MGVNFPDPVLLFLYHFVVAFIEYIVVNEKNKNSIHLKERKRDNIRSVTTQEMLTNYRREVKFTSLCRM